ncbi:MAG: PSD1 and planctomycete cytochrome C domain-containing protein [Pirellulales bacterium]
MKRLIAFVLFAALASRAFAEVPIDIVPPQIDFIRDVRPIFERSCYTCHGAEKQKSEYRLDVRDVALKGGELYAPSIVPGKSDESPLLQFVTGDGDLTMPPEGEQLSDREIAILRAWIDGGAVWPDEVAGEVVDKADWWSWQPLTRPAVPEVEHDGNSPRIANPIDAFIVSELARHELRQAPQADRRTLIRRVYFDLIGLPPTPEEVAVFLADDDPRAYEVLIDKLLASPRYGERWARHWMDAAHFAETHGHDQDRIREHAWPYRDYLIAALNSDKPYGQFIQEQVAGDALFPNDPQATVALGFLAAGPWDESSLRDILEDTIDRQIGRYLDRDDMLSNAMNNVVSLTVQCARCHDHKFDAIPQDDYYALQAVFAGVERANRVVDHSPEVKHRRLELTALKQALEQPTDELHAELLAVDAQRQVAEWEQQLSGNRVRWLELDPETFTSAEGTTLVEQPDHSLLASGARPDRDTYTITAPLPLETATAIRVEVLTHDSLPLGGPGRQDNGNLHLSEIEIRAGDAEDPLVAIASTAADFNQPDWGIEKAVDGVSQTAWGVYPRVGEPHEAVFELKEPLRAPSASRVTVILKQNHGGGHLIGRVRLSVTDAAPPVGIDLLPAEVAAILKVPAAERSDAQRLALAVHQRRTEVERELAALPPSSLVYAAASDFEPDGGLKPPPGPRPIHLLHRGDINQPRESVEPGALSCVAVLPSRFDVSTSGHESERRAALARWLTDRNNPLTWRSIVNRVWHHHFGAGIVPTLNDFGHLGSTPSHPQLLDWLAVEFRDGGQSLKTLHRMIVTSETYRQSASIAAHDPNVAIHAQAIDADNRLLWRMNRVRLDAECIHDAVLEFTGRLDLRMGGPSDRQFSTSPGVHVTPVVDYKAFDVNGSTAQRRSVYRFLFRTLPDPLMEALDCPSGDQITPVRANTVTVQQALAMWNDAFVLASCEHLANRLANETAASDKRVAMAVELVFGRPATDEELRNLAAYAEQHGLANMCRLLFNANELLFVN